MRINTELGDNKVLARQPNGLISNNDERLISRLKDCINKADKIYLIVSFIMDSGLKLLIGDLHNAKTNGKEIKILTSDYMRVTEPAALYRLIDLGYTKIFQDKQKTSFHPKAYIFVYHDGNGEAIIGSSNVSFTALTNGVEWNYNLKQNQNSEDFSAIYNEFNELYENSSFDLSIDWIRSYEKSYKKNSQKPFQTEDERTEQIEPIKFQIGALYELSKTREEGYKKALVIVATGLGKTYLAAFDSLGFKRVLFIAHREEILAQAMDTFIRVHGSKKTYGLFKGYEKDTESDIVFASIATLGKQNYLNEQYFSRLGFDYIVIDEFHHAAATSYQRVLDYFQPSFLLGMTATPDRADNGDVYELCDYNIAYECSMKTGINCGWLVPFEYYGIYDETDYTNIPWRNGSYDLNALENALIIDIRNSQIFEQYLIYKKDRTLAFCAGVRHCLSMKEYFSMKKVKCDVITGSTASDSRARILSEFTSGNLPVLFVVDVFNEGVDIPQIDMVMFLRPTSSYTIFTQQLGRGLRTSDNKEKLRVLDFVGNYKYAHLKPTFLSGDFRQNVNDRRIKLPSDVLLPDGCSAQFDFRFIDYLNRTRSEMEPLKERLTREYISIRDGLGYKPSMLEFYGRSNYPISSYCRTFGSWLRFLEAIGDIDEDEIILLSSNAAPFLENIEKTAMTKSYKVPTILCFLQNGGIREKVSIDELTTYFRDFYNHDIYKKDLIDNKHINFESWTHQQMRTHVINNPVNAFLNTSKDLFYLENHIFGIHSEVYQDLTSPTAISHIKARIYIRLKDYFKRKYDIEA